MNLKTEDINKTFSICMTSIVNEIVNAEQTREEEQRLENIRLNEERQHQILIRNSINEHFANLKKMVKSVFAKPSELSQFLLDKVLNKPREHHFLNRQVMVKKGRTKPCPEFDSLIGAGAIVAMSMKMKDVRFQMIDLVKIDTLSSEQNQFFLALGIPSIGFQVDAKSICQIEPIAYQYRQAQGGALYMEECHISTSFSVPANPELRNVLKNLCEFSIFCDTLLKKHQHLITS